MLERLDTGFSSYQQEDAYLPLKLLLNAFQRAENPDVPVHGTKHLETFKNGLIGKMFGFYLINFCTTSAMIEVVTCSSCTYSVRSVGSDFSLSVSIVPKRFNFS
jgi:hypothetical protein